MKKALIISGIFWDDTWQRHQNVAKFLAESGFSVDFLGGVKTSSVTFNKVISYLGKSRKGQTVKNTVPDNLRELSVFNLPYEILSQFSLSKLTTSGLHKHYDLVICYVPSPLTKKLLNHIEFEQLIYDCVRNFEGWDGISKNVVAYESKLAQVASRIWVDSYFLKDRFERSYQDKVTQLFPTVNRLYNFPVKETRSIKHVGFFGSVSKHFDIMLLPMFAKLGIKLHLWGVDELGIAEKYEHVIYHGYETDERKLLNLVYKQCDALIIPYVGNMDGVIPAKLFQSLSLKLPVFISDFYDSRKLDNVLYVYESVSTLAVKLQDFDYSEFETRLPMADELLEKSTLESFKNAIMQDLQIR